LNFQVNNEMYDEPNYEYTKLDWRNYKSMLLS
jgi:hypothetical protein